MPRSCATLFGGQNHRRRPRWDSAVGEEKIIKSMIRPTRIDGSTGPALHASSRCAAGVCLQNGSSIVAGKQRLLSRVAIMAVGDASVALHVGGSGRGLGCGEQRWLSRARHKPPQARVHGRAIQPELYRRLYKINTRRGADSKRCNGRCRGRPALSLDAVRSFEPRLRCPHPPYPHGASSSPSASDRRV
jgi:hypothetical protein